MTSPDIRWKQRFQNLENAMHFLDMALKIAKPNIIEKAGLIQFFEICFELSWNVLKDYLEGQGVEEIRFPRESIKKAYEFEMIRDGELWLEALSKRNATSHLYDETMADEVILDIRVRYYPLLQDLYIKLKMEI